MAKETIDVLNALILIIGNKEEAVKHLRQLQRVIFPNSSVVGASEGAPKPTRDALRG